MATPYKVLIVDDSSLMRQLLTQILSSDPDLEIEMPRMDGLTFLDKLMHGHPMPVVMISTLTSKGADITLRALDLGAVDFVPKPKLDVSRSTIEQAEEILAKVKNAARAKIRRPIPISSAPAPIKPTRACNFSATHKVVAIGASTGGTEALKELLSPLPPDFPGIVIVQHMPEAFTRQFAERLDSVCSIRVQEAKDGDRILPGLALLAPGGHQMAVFRKGMEYAVRVYRGERVNRHLPSVDVLFSSCARELGRNVVGVMLTGMGADGSRGMLEMKNANAFNIAQDEASCVVFGMPREAIALNAVDEVLPLNKIPDALINRLAA